MARQPKPIDKILEDGTYRKDRHKARKDLEATVTHETTTQCPEGVSAKTKAIWEEMTTPLFKHRNIDASELELLRSTAFIIENIHRLRELLPNLTALKDITTAINTLNKSISSLTAILSKFGVTPVERAKVANDFKPNEEDGLTLAQRLRNAKKAKSN